MERSKFIKRLTTKPVLYRHKNIWRLHCAYDDRELPKLYGFRWSPDEHTWWTDEPKKAVKLIRYASFDTKAELLELFATAPF